MREGWEYKKLGEVCEIYQPKTLATEQLVADGKYYVYGANGIIGKYNEFNHEESEILLTCRGATCGTINVSKPFSWINGNAMVIHRKSEDLSFDFLRYLMLSLDYSLIITGAAQPQITRQKLSPTQIKFPYLPLQQSIVSELDEINNLLSLKRMELETYDKLAQSLFYEMFGDPVENEKGWEVKKVVDVITLQRGFDLPTHDRMKNGKIPVYGSNGILDYHNECKQSKGIITGRSGTIGKVFVSEEPFWPLNTTLFSKDTHGNNIVYLCYLLRFFDLNRFVEGAGVPTLNRNNFHNKQIISPPLPLQQLFAQRIEAIEQQKAQVKAAIEKLETLLAARMQYWFE